MKGHEWRLISEEKPVEYVNVLLAFEGHWNQVVGFRSRDKYWETGAHDCNSEIAEPMPKWWMPIAEVPHKPFWAASSSLRG